MSDSAAPLNVNFAPIARAQYLAARQRVQSAGRFAEFREANIEIIRALSDPVKAQSLGEVLYKTNLPGGEVRVWYSQGIAVTYALFIQQNAAFIVRYVAHDERWMS